MALDPALFEQLSLDDVLGRYERDPMQNPWHGGDIAMVDGGLLWTNDDGVSWPLTASLADGKLLTDEQCPYFESDMGDAFVLELTQDASGAFIPEVAAFGFLGESYIRK